MTEEERIEDPATMAALLRVHGELELEPRLGRLLQEILSLAGKDRGWVVTPSEEPGGSPALQVQGAEGPEPATAGALDDLEEWTEEERSFGGEDRFSGVGPLLAFPVRG